MGYPKFNLHERQFEDGSILKFFVEPSDTGEFMKMRAESLLTKEPETITWLDRMDENDVLWDVGACVGSYSIYSALMYGVRVCAFEPAYYNHYILERNIEVNKLNDLVTAYPIAIGSTHHYDYLLHGRWSRMGSSGNNVYSGKQAGVRDSGPGGDSAKDSKYKTGCVVDSINNLVNRGLPYPTHIKVDVDGAEPDIIKGALKVLPNIKSILIELNPNPKKSSFSQWPIRKQHQKVIDTLESIGMVLDEKLYQVSAERHDRGEWIGQRNYIFYKS